LGDAVIGDFGVSIFHVVLIFKNYEKQTTLFREIIVLSRQRLLIIIINMTSLRRARLFWALWRHMGGAPVQVWNASGLRHRVRAPRRLLFFPAP
jgi:hypothetical protein